MKTQSHLTLLQKKNGVEWKNKNKQHEFKHEQRIKMVLLCIEAKHGSTQFYLLVKNCKKKSFSNYTHWILLKHHSIWIWIWISIWIPVVQHAMCSAKFESNFPFSTIFCFMRMRHWHLLCNCNNKMCDCNTEYMFSAHPIVQYFLNRSTSD